MACRGRGEGQGFVRGRWWLGCSAGDDNFITGLVNTFVQRDQGRHAGLSVKQDTYPCSNILRWHPCSSRNQFYMASTPAFCIRTCYKNSTAFLSVGWKFAKLVGCKGKESRCCHFCMERLLLRLQLFAPFFLSIKHVLHFGGRFE